MKLLLSIVAISLVSSLPQVCTSKDSQPSALADEKWSIHSSRASFAALSDFEASFPNTLSAWSEAPSSQMAWADWSAESLHKKQSDWDSQVWNSGNFWDRTHDGDLNHIIDGGEWFDHDHHHHHDHDHDDYIGAVPEASSWLLMSCGAAALGAWLARRSRRA